MTALHQAAQKAVEALTFARRSLAPYGGNSAPIEAALATLVSALQQQPEPVAKPSRVGEDGWRKLAESQAALLALQEVPREPVAPHTALLEQALSAMAEVQEQADSGSPDGTLIPDSDWRAFVDAHAELSMLWTAWRDSPGWVPLDDTTAAVPLGVLERGEGGAFRVHANMDALRAIYAMPPGEHMLYASPSTTQQQEAGSGWKLVPVEPTPEMIAAYLRANDAYWKRTDELPTPPNKWRTGTPRDATAESYRAMIAAAPSTPAREEALRLAGAAGLDPDQEVVDGKGTSNDQQEQPR